MRSGLHEAAFTVKPRNCQVAVEREDSVQYVAAKEYFLVFVHMHGEFVGPAPFFLVFLPFRVRRTISLSYSSR